MKLKILVALTLVIALSALAASMVLSGEKDEERGECVLRCIENNADVPEELEDPWLHEQCRKACIKNPDCKGFCTS